MQTVLLYVQLILKGCKIERVTLNVQINLHDEVNCFFYVKICAERNLTAKCCLASAVRIRQGMDRIWKDMPTTVGKTLNAHSG